MRSNRYVPGKTATAVVPLLLKIVSAKTKKKRNKNAETKRHWRERYRDDNYTTNRPTNRQAAERRGYRATARPTSDRQAIYRLKGDRATKRPPRHRQATNRPLVDRPTAALRL